MIPILTTERIREVEAEADSASLSYAEMMERAGRAAAERAFALIADVDQPRITLLIGPGNNGGDGIVAGIHLAKHHPDADIRFYLLVERPDDDPLMQRLKDGNHFLAYAEHDSDKRVLRHMVASADLLVDALFGIGIRLPLRESAAKLLRAANQAINERRASRPGETVIDVSTPHQVPRAPEIRVLAIDGPSGLNFDTGELDKTAIHADETISFIAAKPGLLTYPAAEAVGRLIIADLGVSAYVSQVATDAIFLCDAETVRRTLPKRTDNSHKGSFGRALIVGGSTNYIGAPALSALAAYRIGAGLVTIATPRPVGAVLAGQILESTWLMLPHDMGILNEAAANVLFEENMSDFQAMLIGPGMGNDKATHEFLITFLSRNNDASRPAARRQIGFQIDNIRKSDQADNERAAIPPLIIDADGLNILADTDNWWKLLPVDTVLTPHPGEMGRLCGLSTHEINEKRLEIAQTKAEEWQAIVVLKGAHTVVAAPDGRTSIMPFKNSALATAGTGDVLAGLIAGLIANGLSAFEAAFCGAYIHGLVGEKARATNGARAVIASDLIHSLSTSIRELDA